jgi:D-alanyl-D-alanine carboxypeptidase
MKTAIQHLTLLICTALLLQQPLWAQVPSQSEIEAFILKNMKELHIPAVSYGVMQNGQLISSGTYGLAEVELNVPANEHTLFNVGSVGKTFTATAILLLEEDGVLSIKDPISKHLDGIPESWDNITIEHLLNHTSGIKDYCMDYPGYELLPNIDRAIELTPEQYIEMCTSNPLNFPTGTRWAYSNSNYALLGFIIQKHIGTSMDAFMRKRIFEPAGMMDSRYDAAFELRPNRAKGYHWDSTGVKNGALISNFYSTLGDCGILTTGGDLAKWAPALLSGKIISRAQLEKMWTPHRLSDGGYSLEDFKCYALGWQTSDLFGSPELSHGGALMKGYTATYHYYPEYDLSIAVMANRWVGAGIFSFKQSLVELFLPADLQVSSLKASIGSDADNWLKKLKDFATALETSGDLSPIAATNYIAALDKEADGNNVWFGKTLNTANIEFLLERELSAANLIKHGIKANKVVLFRAHHPVVDPNSDVYLSMYLDDKGEIIGVSIAQRSR